MFCEVYKSHPWPHGWKLSGWNPSGPWVLEAGVPFEYQTWCSWAVPGCPAAVRRPPCICPWGHPTRLSTRPGSPTTTTSRQRMGTIMHWREQVQLSVDAAGEKEILRIRKCDGRSEGRSVCNRCYAFIKQFCRGEPTDQQSYDLSENGPASKIADLSNECYSLKNAMKIVT